MPRRNPLDPHRITEANRLKTEKRIERFLGLKAILATWELMPTDFQYRNQAYLQELRAKVHQNRNYILHRADPQADRFMPKPELM